MLFHIVVIKIRWELAEIEFAKKKFPIFHLWVAFLTEYFTCTVEDFLKEQKSAENPVFQKSIFSAECVGRSI